MKSSRTGKCRGTSGDVDEVSEEGLLKGKSVRIMNVPGGSVDGRGGEAGVRANRERNDVKKAGLEVIGGGNETGRAGQTYVGPWTC